MNLCTKRRKYYYNLITMLAKETVMNLLTELINLFQLGCKFINSRFLLIGIMKRQGANTNINLNVLFNFDPMFMK